MTTETLRDRALKWLADRKYEPMSSTQNLKDLEALLAEVRREGAEEMREKIEKRATTLNQQWGERSREPKSMSAKEIAWTQGYSAAARQITRDLSTTPEDAHD